MKMDALRLVAETSVYSPQTIVDLPLFGVNESSPFILKGADGLDPPEISVRMGRTVFEKSIYQGKSPLPRQIILTIGLNPDWNYGQTSSDLRTILYGLLTPRNDTMVRMDVMHNGVAQAYAEGQISKFEASTFTKDPAVQITLECDQGYLLEPSLIVQVPDISNPYDPYRVYSSFLVENTGTAPTSFTAGFRFAEDLYTSSGPGTQVPSSTLILRDQSSSGKRLQIDGIFWKYDDVFVVDTRPGSRGVWRGVGQGPLVSVLNNVNAEHSSWLTLHGGDNVLEVNIWNLTFNEEHKFRHQPAYWGV